MVSLQPLAFSESQPYICIVNKNKKTIMKTTSLFIAALVVVSAAFGKEEPSSKGLAVVPVKGSEVFKVIYKGETAGRVKLNIYNVNGSVVFTESFSGTDGFIRPLNFKGLESGEYIIELVDASGKKTEKISYSKTVSAKSIHVSKVAESDKYLLAVAGAGSEEIRVNIYDGGNNLVHSEIRVVNGDYAQLYSLKNVNGTVTFEVTDKEGIVKTASF